MSKVSIIMPYLNREAVIAETILSVLNQTYFDWELIAVDNGSTDDSTKILDNYAANEERIKIYKNLFEPKGPSACRNLGAKYATGDYLIFLDSDDLLASQCCEQRVEIMESYPDLDFAVFSMGMFCEKPGDIDGRFNKSSDSVEGYLNYFLSLQTPWQTTCPIWRKSHFVSIGGFNENFLVKTDPELHTRVLLLHQPKFKYFEELPIDCFYRINYMDSAKSQYIDEASITYRIKFFKKSLEYLKNSKQYSVATFRRSLKKGILSFYKEMFVDASTRRNVEYFEFLEWSLKNVGMGIKNYGVLYLLGKIKRSPDLWVKKLHLAGILYRIL